jgi:integrase
MPILSELSRLANTAPDAFGTVIKAYLGSPQFSELAQSTQQGYFRYLRLIVNCRLGATHKDAIGPQHMQAHIDSMASKPGAQINAFVALKAVQKWAAGPRQLLKHPILTGCEVIGSDGGNEPWTDAQIEIGVKHAKPELARVIMLASSTGQRGSDLILMCWNHIEKDRGRSGIKVTQKKTGLELWIPMTQALSDALATWDRAPGPILRRADGQPWPRRNLMSVAWSRERDGNPLLEACRGLTLHGLRATACVRLRRLGATESQISDMVGLSIPMVARYCRKSKQRDNAMAAADMLDQVVNLADRRAR